MTMAGHLSAEQFAQEAADFVTKSQLLHDNWRIEQVDTNPESVYLVKNSVCQLQLQIHLADSALDSCISASDIEIAEDTESTLHESSVAETISFEYHIIYSLSYAVPVLYFNAFKANGRLLTLDELLSVIPCQFSVQDKWQFITQHEHPILGRPFFQLHPCHTETMMSKLNLHTGYLIAWLSSVAPAIHLQLPIQLAKI